MSEETSTVKSEIDEYINNLHTARHNLVNFQTCLPADGMLYAEANVVVIAIDGLKKELETPDLSENVDLATIIKISDSVLHVMTHANKILAKRPRP